MESGQLGVESAQRVGPAEMQGQHRGLKPVGHTPSNGLAGIVGCGREVVELVELVCAEASEMRAKRETKERIMALISRIIAWNVSRWEVSLEWKTIFGLEMMF